MTANHPKHHLIYIPGLGDRYDGLRRMALSTWRLWGMSPELVPMQWYGGDSYQVCFNAILAAIKRAEAKGYKVTLVGESAGASIAINVAASQPNLHGLITLCGVTHPHATVSPLIRKKSPAFNESLSYLETSLPKLNLATTHCIRALFDFVVVRKYSLIEGAHHHAVWGVGHLLVISLCLSLYSGYIVRIARTIQKHR